MYVKDMTQPQREQRIAEIQEAMPALEQREQDLQAQLDDVGDTINAMCFELARLLSPH